MSVAVTLTQRDFVAMDDDYARVALDAIAGLVAGTEIQPFLVRPRPDSAAAS
jgi:hypothetical protein